MRAAYQQRAASDYIFERPGWNIFLSIITCGIFGFFLFYQLMRRDRDHNRRRLELLDAANALAWEQASEWASRMNSGRYSSESALNLRCSAASPASFVTRRSGSSSPSLPAASPNIVGYIFIDQDLDAHDRAEGAIEADLASIYSRLGQPLPTPDPARVKGKHNYVGRVIATILTCGIYSFWWLHNMQVEGNRHLENNWMFDDALANAVVGISG